MNTEKSVLVDLRRCECRGVILKMRMQLIEEFAKPMVQLDNSSNFRGGILDSVAAWKVQETLNFPPKEISAQEIRLGWSYSTTDREA